MQAGLPQQDQEFTAHHPLKLTKFGKDLDDGKNAYSWYEGAQEGAAEACVDRRKRRRGSPHTSSENAAVGSNERLLEDLQRGLPLG